MMYGKKIIEVTGRVMANKKGVHEIAKLSSKSYTQRIASRMTEKLDQLIAEQLETRKVITDLHQEIKAYRHLAEKQTVLLEKISEQKGMGFSLVTLANVIGGAMVAGVAKMVEMAGEIESAEATGLDSGIAEKDNPLTFRKFWQLTLEDIEIQDLPTQDPFSGLQ